MSKRTIDDLRARIAFLENIIENIPTGIIVTDSEGRILMMNRWQEEISRIRREMVLGSYFHEKWDRLFEQGIMGHYWQLLQNEKPFQSTVHEVYPQFYDEKVSALSRGAALSEKAGFVLMHDVSSEMQQDKRDIQELSRQLAESNNFLTNLIDSSPNVVITTDEGGIIQSANKTAEEAFLYSREYFVGRHVSFTLKEPPKLDLWLSIAHSGEPVEVTCERGNGDPFPARMYVRDILGKSGRVQAKLFLLTDLTWERAMEEKLALSEKLAIYSELMAGIAHQLNNPLVGVANFSYLLLERMNPQDPNRALVDTIHEAARKCHTMLATMIKSLREPRSTFHTVDPGDILESALEVALNEERDRFSRVRLIKSLDGSLPPLRGDSLQLREAFRNVLVNAVQAMPEGGTLTVEAGVDTIRQKIRISISDTGIGIPTENRERIFDPFFSTKKESGAGLGLSFAYRVIKSHSGEISVISSESAGTTFLITLPSWHERQDK
ncbi:MAG: ATP-binding protein [Desulfomonilaceae bacterium]